LSLLDYFSKTKTTEKRNPYIIAEVGVNHEGSMELAKRLICEAAEGGAQAVKFQTYKADTLVIKDSPAYWDTSEEATKTQHELFTKYDKFWKTEFEKLKVICDKEGIEFLSTPFDRESANFLNDLMPVFKVSSSDLTNFMFIDYMAQFKKPILLSTGASNLQEIQEVTGFIQKYKLPLCIMHCVLSYPTADNRANLSRITSLGKEFPDLAIGYSDHTKPGDMEILKNSWVLGAEIIEKHFTHDKTLPGNDHYHAMDKEDLKIFWKKIEELKKYLGTGQIEFQDVEVTPRKEARRSLVADKDIPINTVVTEDMLTFKRPAYGISPKEFKSLVGKKTINAIKEDSIIYWKDIEGS